MNNAEFTTQEHSDIDYFLSCIKTELHKATRSFGPFNSTHEGYAVILEELDEAWDDIKANRFADSKKEIIQVAAMCVRYLMDVRTE